MTTSPVSAWDAQYRGLTERRRYGGDETYKMAADFLADCETVEDWGCGMGWFKVFRPDCIGIDGSCTPFADEYRDLVEYVSDCDGILLRHVLDHNYEWRRILQNAIESARKVCVVLFLRPVGETTVTRVDEDTYPGVPDIAFALPELGACFPDDWIVKYQFLEGETVITAER